MSARRGVVSMADFLSMPFGDAVSYARAAVPAAPLPLLRGPAAPRGGSTLDADAQYASLLALDDAVQRPGLSEAERRRLKRGAATAAQCGGSCQICLETVQRGQQVTSLRCSHAFHSACLDTWLASAKTCPVCRNEAA